MVSPATLSKIFAGLAIAGLLAGSASVFFVGPSGKPAAKAPIVTPSHTILPTVKASPSKASPSATPTPKPSKQKTAPPASPSAKPSTSKPSSKPSTVKPSPKPTTPKPTTSKPVAPSTRPTSTPVVPAPTVTPKPSPTPTQSQVTQVYGLINQERQKRGLGIVYRTDRLEASAQSWSVQMANDSYMRHNNPLPSGVYGECIARGYPTATAVMTAWMNSTGHRNIILGNYSQVGVGYVANGGWWTLQFA